MSLMPMKNWKPGPIEAPEAHPGAGGVSPQFGIGPSNNFNPAGKQMPVQSHATFDRNSGLNQPKMQQPPMGMMPHQGNMMGGFGVGPNPMMLQQLFARMQQPGMMQGQQGHTPLFNRFAQRNPTQGY
jgi:hypothetical protein